MHPTQLSSSLVISALALSATLSFFLKQKNKDIMNMRELLESTW